MFNFLPTLKTKWGHDQLLEICLLKKSARHDFIIARQHSRNNYFSAVHPHSLSAGIKISIKAILNYKFAYYVLASFPKHTYPIENLSVSFHRLSFANKTQTCNYLMIVIEGFKFCFLSSKSCSLNYCIWLTTFNAHQPQFKNFSNDSNKISGHEQGWHLPLRGRSHSSPGDGSPGSFQSLQARLAVKGRTSTLAQSQHWAHHQR